MPVADDGISPDWPVPAHVRALQLTVGASLPVERLPASPSWLEQVHGTDIVEPTAGETGRVADGAIVRALGIVAAVRTADCLPVLLYDADSDAAAAVHAGWRGLAAGVLEQAVSRLGGAPQSMVAWFGPCIGQQAFEVGPEVRAAFTDDDPSAMPAFVAGSGDRWHADLAGLARHRLGRVGVRAVHGGGWCTYSDPSRFHSYRRDGGTGRMATLVWMEPR